MVALLFYNALYGINYRLPNITWIVVVGIHSVVRVVKGGAVMILPVKTCTEVYLRKIFRALMLQRLRETITFCSKDLYVRYDCIELFGRTS